MAKGSSSSFSDSTLVTGTPQDASAKSLFHALSEIEQLSAAELRSSLPEGSLPMQPRFTFIDVACKNAAVMTLFTFLTAPLSIAVVEKIMPAFGNTNPSLIDKIYVYLFSSAPAIAFALLITSVISKTYTGKVTKSIVNRFTSSYVATKILVSLFMLYLFYVLAASWFTPDNVWGVLSYLDIFFRKVPQAKEDIYNWLMDFRKILVPAAIYATLVHIGTAALISIGYIRGDMRTRQIELLRKEWE
jgi:hypothetical protein